MVLCRVDGSSLPFSQPLRFAHTCCSPSLAGTFPQYVTIPQYVKRGLVKK